MVRRTSPLLALALLCGIGQGGVSVADETRFIAHLPQGTVELVGVTDYPPTLKSQWWRPDGSAASVGSFRPDAIHRWRLPANQKELTFLVRFENMPADASPQPAGGVSSSTTPEWPPPETSRFGTRSWLPGRVRPASFRAWEIYNP